MRGIVWLSLVALAAIAGCGGSSSRSQASLTGSSSGSTTASLPACAGVKKALPLPQSFPRSFPLPPGLVITSSRTSYYNSSVIHGVMPSQTFARSLSFFMRELPRAGFKLTEHDSEPPREGEGAYRGNGYVGRWKIHNIPGCAHVLTVDVSAAKA